MNTGSASIPDNFRAIGWMADFGYFTRWPLNASERWSAYSLRAQVFGDELAWAKPSTNGLEMDEFDKTSVHFGIFCPQGQIVATARVTPAGQPWMLDSCFLSLRPSELPQYQYAHACEISRLALSPTLRSRPIHPGVLVVDLMYKALFHFCRLHAIQHGYVVITPPMLRHMRQRGLVCRQITPFKRMQDGVYAGVALVDWEILAQRSRQGRGLLLQRSITNDSIIAPRTGQFPSNPEKTAHDALLNTKLEDGDCGFLR